MSTLESITASQGTKLSGIAEGANKTIVDSSLSSTSANPVQNKVINTALSTKANSSSLNNYLPLSGGDITGNLGVKGSLNTDTIRSFSSTYSSDGKTRAASLSITPIKFDETEPLIKLDSKMDSSSGDTVKTQTLTINGEVTVTDRFTVEDSIFASQLELTGLTSTIGQPFIDFHFDNSDEDYTSRIIETSKGCLQIDARNGVILPSISSSPIVDYPIESGSKDSIIIEKFANGLVIMSSRIRVFNMVAAKLGSDDIMIKDITWPVSLVAVYAAHANSDAVSGYGTYGNVPCYWRSLTNTGGTLVFKNKALDMWCSYTIIGSWK